MVMIETVRGPIDADGLGRVLVHEHVFTADIELMLNYGRFDEGVEVAKAADKLNAIKASGIDTIVDLTVLGLGRFIPRIQQVAALTDLNIIVATGCYTLNELPMAFRSVGPGLMFDEPCPMPGMFIGDIRDGIADTGVRAGALKCAIDMAGLTDGVERVMRAVAKAQLATGAPISVHTAPAAGTGLVAQRVLAEEGVDLRDVIIGHSGDSKDIAYLTALAEAGSILGMDRFGINLGVTQGERVATIVELVRRGFLDRIALSHDCYCWTNLHPGGKPALPTHNYLTVSTQVIPALIEAGLTRDQVEVMLVDNPRRHFVDAAERHAARTSIPMPG